MGAREEARPMKTRRTAIVTGASQGIGACLVKTFIERGNNVVASLPLGAPVELEVIFEVAE
jgi:NAD(P)-dependent dehydrogenase (short-subunit alcohol dehydrogenase family)